MPWLVETICPRVLISWQRGCDQLIVAWYLLLVLTCPVFMWQKNSTTRSSSVASIKCLQDPSTYKIFKARHFYPLTSLWGIYIYIKRNTYITPNTYISDTYCSLTINMYMYIYNNKCIFLDIYYSIMGSITIYIYK